MKKIFLAVSMLLLLPACTHKPVESGMPPTPAAPVVQIPGYLTAPGGGLATDAHGRCWRTADWRPILAIEACDPQLVRERRAAELALALAAVAAPAAGPAAGAADTAGAAATAAGAEGGEGAGSAAATVPAAVPMQAAAVAATLKPGYVTKPVVLNTDAAFFFGKDRLTAAGKDAVENLAAYIKLWGIEEVQVEVVGHSDRIGNAKDNMALSRRRAEAVQQVLVEAGVPAASISATGMGSTQPVTGADTCPDDLVRCDLINCLAPDRRVEVGLKGTRQAPLR